MGRPMQRANSHAEVPFMSHNNQNPMVQKRHYGKASNDQFGEIYHHKNSSTAPQQPFTQEKEIYDYEKLLLEQDAHLLEEQRYLNRLKNSEIRQNRHFSDHYSKVMMPNLMKKKEHDQHENMRIETRLKALTDYQKRQATLKQELNHIHAGAIQRQIESSHKRKRDEATF